ILLSVLITIGFLLPPALTELQKKGKQNEMKLLYQVITKWMFLIGVPIFSVLFFAPKLVLELLFGQRYVPGVSVLRILLIGYLFSTLLGLTFRTLVGLGRNRIVAYTTFGQLLVNSTLNVLLIPIFGISGAAIALAGSVFVGNTLNILILYRHHNIHPFTNRMIHSFAALLGVSAIGYYVVEMFSFQTATVILFVAVAYPFVVVKLAIGPQDKYIS
ncbi:MAG: polysaccharide biosynthesis C-terminal domain-containing protein, partial [Halobacteriaceae archaeon]